MNKTLTQEQIKTLKLFSYYCQSYGCKNFRFTIHLYDCEVDYIPNNGFCTDGTSIEIYDKIEELLTYIAKELVDYDKLQDVYACERGNSTLEFDFDLKERKLSVEGYYEDIVDNYSSIEEEYSGNEDIESFMSDIEGLGLDSVSVDFSGGGDSGYINDSTSNGVALPAGVEDYLYRMLSSNYGGWELDNGSDGTFTFFSKSKTIVLEFNEHLSQTESVGKVFYVEY